MSMKEPSLSRWRRPNSSKKLKLVCSFNGQFHTRPYSGKLTYVGGDTRIISVDRGIGFLKLWSKISELCPNTTSFFLKYRLPESDPLHADTTNLVLITSDDDVRCMVDEYDKIDSYGQQSRLRLFVCSDNGYVNVNLPVNWTDSRIDCGRGKRGIDFLRNETRGEFGDYPSNVSRTRSESHLFGLQFDAIEINNPETAVAGDWRSDHSLIKPVVKKQLPVTKPAPVSSIWNGEREFGGSYEQKYCQPLIDLALEALVPNITQTANMNIEHPHEAKYLNCKTEDALFPGNRDFEILVRNGNTEAYGTGLSGRNAGAMNQDISNTSNGVVQFPQLPFNSSVVSACSDSNAKQALRKIDTLSWTNFNRENFPCPANYNPGKTGLMPLSCSDEMVGSAYPMEILSTSDRLGDLQSGIRRHKFGVWDTRNHRVCLYHTRNHQNNLSDMGSNRNLRLDGRPSSVRCCPGLRPNSNITKQGQSMRSYHPNYLKPWFCTHTHALQGLMRMMDSSFNSLSSSHGLLHANKNKIDQGIIGSEHGNLNVRQSTFAYHGPYSGMGNLPLLSGNAVENPLKDGFLIDYGNGMHEVPQQNPYKNFHGVLTNCESGCHDPKHPFSWLPQKVENISAFPNYPGYGKGTKLKGNSKLSDREACFVSLSTNCDGAACTLQGGVASPVETRHDSASVTLPGRVASPADLSLCNLSLSSSKEVGPLVLSSPVYPDVSETVLKSKSKHLDLIDGYSGPEGYKSNGMESGSFTGAVANFGNDYVHKEEIEQDPSSALNLDEKVCTKESHKSSKVIGGASSDMAAFYSLLATRELQTIKNSDLEYIKELGSGTYGTVSYGKWKGSDVAIKRIKPSCFTQNTLKKDRLVVDFWKEAHMLGQLHHPNIVAFYGVVTDGPMKILATVTEYMVNGSLKQVLQKRDRTIDHRKRLIIARDAAFGMEYLHGKNIVHFDLKSHNFLMNMRDPQRPVCKIGDLGLSKIKQRTLISGGLRGTIPWMAPELFNSKNDLVTEKVDVYSFGIVMWELLTGEEPYGKLCSEEIIGGIIKGNLRPEIPTCDPAWRSLMERCWSSDPGSRPDFSEIAKELRVMSAAMNIK